MRKSKSGNQRDRYYEDLTPVTIHNQQQQDFLWNLQRAYPYYYLQIGLNDIAKEDEEVWADGSQVNYRNHKDTWDPNDGRDHANCFAMTYGAFGKWVEVKCGNYRGIMQRKGKT